MDAVLTDLKMGQGGIQYIKYKVQLIYAAAAVVRHSVYKLY